MPPSLEYILIGIVLLILVGLVIWLLVFVAKIVIEHETVLQQLRQQCKVLQQDANSCEALEDALKEDK